MWAYNGEMWANIIKMYRTIDLKKKKESKSKLIAVEIEEKLTGKENQKLSMKW